VRSQQLSTDHVAEQLTVRPALNDEEVERLRGVEGDVLAALPQRVDVEAATFEARVDAPQVLGGADDDRRIVHAEPFAHVLTYAVDEGRGAVVELDGVPEEVLVHLWKLFDAHGSNSCTTRAASHDLAELYAPQLRTR